MAQYAVYTAEGRKRKTIYGKTRAVMAEKLTKAMADRDVGIVYDAGKLTVGDYLERWLRDSVKGSVKETTYANYGHFARRHICPALGRLKLKNLTPAHMRSFYGEKSRSGLSAATVKKMHVVLHRALSQAVTDGLIPRNAAHGVRTPRVGDRERRLNRSTPKSVPRF
jgi:integrase